MAGLDIGIVGAGVGGLAAAIALQKQGHRVSVHEQTGKFARVGADINLTPNAVRALDGLGDHAEQQYGAPQITIHRADVLAALTAAFPIAQIQFGKRMTGMQTGPAATTLQFEDGSSQTHDVVIGADGIHSRVRAALFGAESPRFAGVVSFRAVVPTERVNDVPEIGAFTKWWGPNPQSQIVTFPLNQGTETFVFATPAQAVSALPTYAQARQERTAKIQIGSRGNQWMKTQGNADWMYGYDAWTVPLQA